MLYKSLLAIGVAATGAIGVGVFGGAIGLSERTAVAESPRLAQVNCTISSSPKTRSQLADPAWEVKDSIVRTTYDQKFRGHSRPVTSVAFSPDNRFLASGSEDKTVKIWDLQQKDLFKILPGSKHEITSVAFSPNGRFLADISRAGGLVRLWDWKRDILLDKSARLFWGAFVTFSPDSRTLAASGVGQQPVKLWRVENSYLDEIRPTFREDQAIDSIAFSPDGRAIASAGKVESTIKLWNAATGRQLCVLGQHSSNVTSVTFSLDGRYLASASADNTIKLWSLQTGKLISTLKGHTARVNSLAFSPSGEILLSGGRDKVLNLWRVATGEQIRSVEKNSDEVLSVAFRSDGKAFATGSADTTVQVFTYSPR